MKRSWIQATRRKATRQATFASPVETLEPRQLLASELAASGNFLVASAPTRIRNGAEVAAKMAWVKKTAEKR